LNPARVRPAAAISGERSNVVEPLSLSSIPAEDEALRAPVRAFLEEALSGRSSEDRARSWMGFDAEFSRAMAARGWVGLTLPVAYGGGGRSAFARFVVVEELLVAGAPVSAHWFADRQSGPLLLRYGSETQKRCYLPRICKAEAFFCVGMSEPQSGSDLASVRTRAVRTAHGWRLNGQKVWTTNATRSHYMVALVRSSGSSEDRQRGLSQFIVDLALPGVTIRSIKDLTGDDHFSEVFFEDVELTEDALIGAEGAGWEQVTAELAFERSGPERLYSSIVLLDAWLSYLRGQQVQSRACVALVGKIVVHLATLRAMSIAVTEKIAKGASPIVEAVLVKDLGTELEQQIPIAIANLLGEEPDKPVPASLARTLAYVTHIAPSYSLRGGTREILRGMIARGLGLR
jgi:alkylation response protein AidB-like acyl-CoA dehydrogenase